MANKIDFLKRGLSPEAKDYLDGLILSTKTEAENAFNKAVSTKEIEKYVARARREDWVAGPVETLCDDYWYGEIEKRIIGKILGEPAETDGQIRNIPDLDNVLYGIYSEHFTSLMAKKGFDDAIFHNEVDGEFEGLIGSEEESGQE